jgi:predicted DsbA family dithiol-disulfide isomerase
MQREELKIEIWSDIVCPFCFLGKKKLDKAITRLNAEKKIEVVWRSFQLEPNYPKDTSAPTIEDLSAKKGLSIQQVQDMCSSLATQGQNYGIDFNFDRALSFNTKEVQRLIHWAKSFGVSSELAEAFMKAYFTEGIDLSKVANLYSIIQQVGLDIDVAKTIVQSDAYAHDVDQDIEKARNLGIRGVPFFLINGTEAIYGAQSDQVFEQLLSTALEK